MRVRFLAQGLITVRVFHDSVSLRSHAEGECQRRVCQYVMSLRYYRYIMHLINSAHSVRLVAQAIQNHHRTSRYQSSSQLITAQGRHPTVICQTAYLSHGSGAGCLSERSVPFSNHCLYHRIRITAQTSQNVVQIVLVVSVQCASQNCCCQRIHPRHTSIAVTFRLI